MQKEDLYPYDRYHCDDKELYQNEKLTNAFEKIYSNQTVLEGSNYYQGDPRKFTTNGFTGLANTKLPGAKNLIKWIEQCLIKSSTKFWGKQATGVRFQRNWSTLMLKNHHMSLHKHDTVHPSFIDGKVENHYYNKLYPDLCVAVFYVCVPEVDAADLVFVKNGPWAVFGTSVSDVPNEEKQHIPVKTGDLIVHHGSVWHGVSANLTDEKRIAMIFDFYYTLD